MAIPEHLSKTGRSDSTVLMGELDGRHVRRTNIVKEMLDTEESYVEGLRTLIKVHEELGLQLILPSFDLGNFYFSFDLISAHFSMFSFDVCIQSL